MIRHIYGNVNGNGSVLPNSGSGDFSVVHEGNGVYTIVFTPEFAKIPTVILTQNFPGWNEFSSDGGNTRDNAVLIAVSNDRAKLKTGNENGDGNDRNFGFVAIG